MLFQKEELRVLFVRKPAAERACELSDANPREER